MLRLYSNTHWCEKWTKTTHAKCRNVAMGKTKSTVLGLSWYGEIKSSKLQVIS